MGKNSLAKTYMMLTIACVVWGFQPVCIKWILPEWSPVTMTAMRYIVISIILMVVAYYSERENFLPHGKMVWLYLFGMGLTGILLNNVLQITGLRYTTVINCTLISAVSPALTAFMAVFLIHERLNVFSWFGILISFIGVLVVVSDGSWAVIQSIDFHYGDILCFASQVCWAIFSFLALKVMKKVSVLSATLWFGLLGGLQTIAYGLITNDFHVLILTPLAFVSFFYLTIFGGLMAVYFYNIGVKNAGPSKTTIFLNIMPVVGMVSGFLVLQEPVDLVKIMGAVSIIFGVYLTTQGNRLAARFTS